jgi:hypothetical protein
MRNTLLCTVGTGRKANLELSRLEPGDRLLGAEINSITSLLQQKKLDQREYLYEFIKKSV